jgi:hypothetical protein
VWLMLLLLFLSACHGTGILRVHRHPFGGV